MFGSQYISRRVPEWVKSANISDVMPSGTRGEAGQGGGLEKEVQAPWWWQPGGFVHWACLWRQSQVEAAEIHLALCRLPCQPCQYCFLKICVSRELPSEGDFVVRGLSTGIWHCHCHLHWAMGEHTPMAGSWSSPCLPQIFMLVSSTVRTEDIQTPHWVFSSLNTDPLSPYL